jgi:hypothetical protein
VQKLLHRWGSFCFIRRKIEAELDRNKEFDMATYTIILLLLFGFAIMPTTIEERFTRDELAEMGIQLDPASILKTR